MQAYQCGKGVWSLIGGCQVREVGQTPDTKDPLNRYFSLLVVLTTQAEDRHYHEKFLL